MNMNATNTSLPALLLAGLGLIACSAADESSGDDSIGTGGVFASGGVGSGIGGTGGFATGGSPAATGGLAASGGAALTGGAPTTGGTASSGGSSETGGVVGTGGEPATGGTLSTGGTASSGGTSSSGGSVSSGGTSSTGGTLSTGGTSSGGASSGGTSSGGSGSGSCTAAQYVAGTAYSAGQRVSNDGAEYECKPYPYTGWCAGAAFAYEPGEGSAWADAWTLIGACDAGGTGGTTSTGGAPNTGGTSSGGTSSGGTSSGGSSGSGGASGGEPTAQQLLDKVNGCAASATSIKGGFGLDGAGAISMYSCDGAVYWKADLDVDCDGIQTPPCDTDPQGQPQTSIEYLAPNGDVDPTLLPYIVIPLGNSENPWYQAYGIELGQVGAVIYNGQVRYGIFADEAGGSFIGEASYAMCQLFLGKPSGNNDPCDPSNGGIDPASVTYVTFTGTANQAKGADIYDHAKHTAMGVSAAEAWIATP